MIFEPYEDELDIINNIHKYNESEYIVIRITKTMITKNNIDANALFRDLLKGNKLVDYDYLNHGGRNGKKHKAKFIINNTKKDVVMNFYRVKNKRGDRRFSIHGINKFYQEQVINVGDLLYITVNRHGTSPEITIMNVTNNTPSESLVAKLFNGDRIQDSLSRLIPLVRQVAQQGFHLNSKGSGKSSPKDAGDTLEFLLGIKTNNSMDADFEGIIELKSKTSNTLDTLFTLRPNFDNTAVAAIEFNDRSRVSAYTRMYGYESDKRLGYKSLYITIGSEEAPQNSFNFFLKVNDEERKVELRKKLDDDTSVLTAYWNFKELDEKLQQKHPATLWVKTEKRVVDEMAQFKYVEAELSRAPQFTTFLSLIKSGGITYDWRGYTTSEGAYKGKNHGNAWRIKSKQRTLLFGSMESIDLQ